MKTFFLEAVQNYEGARISTTELAKRMSDLVHDVLIVDFWCRWALSVPFFLYLTGFIFLKGNS